MTQADGTKRRRGGRQKGVQNAFTSDIKWATLEAFRQMGGIPWLVKQGKKHPKEFMRLLARLLPRPLELQGTDERPLRIIVVSGVPKDATMTTPTRGYLLGDPTANGGAARS